MNTDFFLDKQQGLEFPRKGSKSECVDLQAIGSLLLSN